MTRSLIALAQRTWQDPTAMGILGANVVAVAIALFQPSVTVSLLFLYWLECLVIGLFNIPKLLCVLPLGTDEAEYAKLSSRDRKGQRVITVVVFMLHYGMFLFMAFGLVHWLAMREMGENAAVGYYGGFLFAAAVLAVVHAISFYVNFLGKREYIGRTGEQQMFRPYGRVALLFGAAFLGITLVSITGLPGAAAVAFVPLKLIGDLHAHFRDHDAGNPAAAA